MNRRVLPNRRPSELIDFEVEGVRYTASVGRFPDGSLAEVFLDGGKIGSAANIAGRDAAVSASLALQHGCAVPTLQHALLKLADGSPAGPLGMALSLAESNCHDRAA